MKKSINTFLKHTAKDFHNQSVNPPVTRASTIIFKSLQDIFVKMQKKYKKTQRRYTLIMVDKELQQHIFYKKFYQN